MTEEKKCLAKTSNGESCNNKALYPKDDPIACHLKSHQEQLGIKVNKEDIDNTKTHIFSSKKLVHNILVRYPRKDKRHYFKVEFSGGKWETDNDEKAELLMDYVNNTKRLKNIIDKVQ